MTPTGPLPDLERSLRWLIAIRLVVITSVTLPYFLLQLANPTRPPTFDLLFIIAGLAYVASAGYAALFYFLRQRPTWHAYIQFAGDLVLVTALVYFFGGIASPFSMLYLVVIMVASVVLRRRSGLLVASIAYLLYAGLLLTLDRGWLPAAISTLNEEDRPWRLAYDLAVHLFGFYAVALLTSFLAERMSRAETELEERLGDLADLEVVHRDIVQSIGSGLITTDLKGRMTSANRAALEILGRTEEEIVGQPLGVFGFMSPSEWSDYAGTQGADERLRAEMEVVRGNQRIPIGFSLTTLASAQGERTGHLLVFQDLSTWRRLQEELRLKDRMAAVGELAAGIAHEVGNPLAAISGSVQLLSSTVDANRSERRLFDIILKESQRLDRTIKGFLRFARPKEGASVRFDVARLLTENTELLRNSEEASGRHRFALELVPESTFLIGDPDQISQIFWNLARNALRAMPEGGDLAISGRQVGDLYRIAFRDTGRGMDEDQRAKLFQPFQTFFDGGTGIGMAIVYRIVHEHGGRIGVDSKPGAGTTITVELPIGPRGAAAVVADARVLESTR